MMRSLVNDIHSLNWRLIFLVTVLFVGFYLLIFDDVQNAQSPQHPKSIQIPKENKGQESKVKSPYDDRFDSQPPLEDPYPVLGDEYDSPLDAVPGRVRPGGNAAPDSSDSDQLEEPDVQVEENVEAETTYGSTPVTEAAAAATRASSYLGNGKGGHRPYESSMTTSVNSGVQSSTTDAVVPSTSSTVETGNNQDIESYKGLTPEPEEINDDDGHYPPALYLDFSHENSTLSTTMTAPPTTESYHPSTEDYNHVNIDPAELDDANSGEEPEVEEGASTDLDDSPYHIATPSHTPQKSYVAICAALKDVPQDLPEWLIHHYHHLQISTFYIMDDGSVPPLSEHPLPSSIPADSVIFDYQSPEQRTPGHSQQITIYTRCLSKWGHLHTWMAFLDGDEFLEMTSPSKEETFPQFLSSFEHIPHVGALAVNWRMHTSSGLLTRPDSVRKAFVDCIWDGANSNNSHVKSIVRTQFADRPVNPHLWYLKEGRQTVGEKGDVVDSEAFRIPITRERIALHHYAGKSREEFEEKMGRGNAMDGESFISLISYRVGFIYSFRCLDENGLLILHDRSKGRGFLG
jgi:hypothetical protein